MRERGRRLGTFCVEGLCVLVFTLSLFAKATFKRVIGKRICSTRARRPLPNIGVACGGVGKSAGKAVSSTSKTCRVTLPSNKVSLLFDCVKCRGRRLPLVLHGKSAGAGSICVGVGAGLLKSMIIDTKHFRRGLDSIAISVSLLGTNSVTGRTPASLDSALGAVPNISVGSGRPSVQNKGK